MRNLIVAFLILGIALPVSARTPAQNYARQVKKQRAKAAIAARAAQQKAEAAAKAEAKKRAADPAYAAAQKEREQQQAAAGMLILGVLVAAMAGSDSGTTESYAEPDDFEDRLRRRREYWEDRAKREAAAGDYDAARSSLEMTK
jgi:hypothetical protein